LVLTFTRKTKAELSSRINGLTEKAKDINISTFHSFGYDVLKKEGLLNKIIDEKEATEIISSLTGKGIKEAKKIYSLISLYRQSGTLHLRDEYPDADLTLRAYIDYKNDNELFDSDDLISVPRALLKRKGTLPYQYIFIDEFQDLNSTQFELLKVLFEHLKEVFAIGDFDQSIYSFRGADFAFFSELESTLENLKTMTLSMTFRCPENIIKPAFNLIKNNIKRYDYNLVSASKNEGNLYHYTALNDYDEAVFIASKIKEYIGSYGLSEDAKTHDTKYFFGDFAVLARTNFMLKKISEVFDKRDIPYTILKEGEFESPLAIRLYDYFKTFLSAKEKKQALMFDDMSFGGNYFDNIRLKSFLGDIFKNHNDIQSWEKEIFNDLAISATSVEDYVYNISVALKNLVASPKSQNVSLLTLHAAKGLEFKKVFIAGVNHGIIPYSLKGDVDIEEERRLFYVGLTRAKEDVYLLSASKRFIYGNTEDSMPSVFLKELGKKLPSPEIIKKNNRVKVCQLELFGRNN
jgi:superfamily I DNA/RNA helicase